MQEIYTTASQLGQIKQPADFEIRLISCRSDCKNYDGLCAVEIKSKSSRKHHTLPGIVEDNEVMIPLYAFYFEQKRFPGLKFVKRAHE
jgi:hypothetical protein